MFYEFKRAIHLRGKPVKAGEPLDPGKSFSVGVHEASPEDEKHEYFLKMVRLGKIVEPRAKPPKLTGNQAKALHDRLVKQGVLSSKAAEAPEVDEAEDEEEVDADVDLGTEDESEDEGFLEKPKKKVAKKVKKKSGRR